MHLIKSLIQADKDVRLLWASVFCRMASFGLTNQVLTLFLKSLSISESNIGIFMTCTLLGDTLLSYYLTWNADRIGRRNVMILGTIMMFAAGLVFSLSSSFVILLIAAIFGVISPSGDETGPFKSVEEASIAHLTPMSHRPEVFAFHGVFATAGVALGSLICGVVVDYFNKYQGWDLIHCYRLIFCLYTIIAMIKFIFMMKLSSNCEISSLEETSLLNGDNQREPQENTSVPPQITSTSGSLSPTTKAYLWRLLVVFMLDSLGYGFMPAAWVVYYFKTHFVMTATALGFLFFCTNSVNAISSLPSAYFAKVLGPVKAMLYTQAPSAVFFLSIAFLDNQYFASMFLILFYVFSTMDVVPRQVLLSSIMPQHELTKVMGIVNICKTFARCVGPVFTGRFAQHNVLYLGFIINGSLTLAADAVLGLGFMHLNDDLLQKTNGN